MYKTSRNKVNINIWETKFEYFVNEIRDCASYCMALINVYGDTWNKKTLSCHIVICTWLCASITRNGYSYWTSLLL